jgi:hypothetical protein
VKKIQILFTALLIFTIFYIAPLVNARIGVGVGTGKIVVTDKLKPGQIYKFPSVAVLNTGDEDGIYGLSIQYHEQQPELKPPLEWFSFDPNNFDLKPSEAKSVDVLVNIPLNAVPGEYFAYLEATPKKKTIDGITAVSVAAAAKLYFTVEPANFIQGVYYRALSIWTLNEPWSSRIAFGLGLVVLVLIGKKYLHIEVNLKKEGSKKKEEN